ncbi:MAG: polyprenyl synthetase family protein [Leptospirales bacterium]
MNESETSDILYPWLKSSYPRIQEVIETSVPKDWPGIRHAVAGLLEGDLPTETVLPLASCKAVGVDPKEATEVTAALLLFAAALRLYDDAVDQDRPGGLWEQVGSARASNYATVVHTLVYNVLSKAKLSEDKYRALNIFFTDAYINIAAGQDKDLAGDTKTVEEYWLTIELKSGWSYALGCACGGLVGSDEPELIESCHMYGYHLGLAKQIMNDYESVWTPDDISDFQQGKTTLPLIYGLNYDHPAKGELLSYVNENSVQKHEKRIGEILDSIDTKQFLIWAALKEREAALEALEPCPDVEGKKALFAYITGMFGDIDKLLDKTNKG